MSHPTRHRLSRPRHAWEDGAFSVALGWTVKKDAEQTHRSALEKRARPVRRRGSAIVSGLVVGSVALLSVWGLSRPRLEAARPVGLPLSQQGSRPMPMAVEQASPSTDPMSQSDVQDRAPSKVSEPAPVPGRARRHPPKRDLASSWTPAPLTPESAQPESLRLGSDAPSNDAKEAGSFADQESASASPRAPAPDRQHIDGSDIVDWFIKEFPRRH
jgi:hypothetical protein